MKKTVILTAALALVGTVAATGLTSCGGGQKVLEVLVQSADHGWTGAVATEANAYVAELEKDDTLDYDIRVVTSDNANAQIGYVNDLVTRKDSLAGVVILPIDNTVEPALNTLVQNDVPFVQFDRVVHNNVIDAAGSSKVGNVLGDNHGIGYETARIFVEAGLEKTDKILVMPGDQSSVPVLRNQGFKDYLVEEAGWTAAEVDAAIYSTDVTNWSRDTSMTLFNNFVTSHTAELSEYKWIFTHDSEISMGILQALNQSTMSQEGKDWYKSTVIKVGSSSGLEEMYKVIRGDHANQTAYDALLGGEAGRAKLFDVTYDPGMITTAIDTMMDYIAEGTTLTEDKVIPVSVIDTSNVDDVVGF